MEELYRSIIDGDLEAFRRLLAAGIDLNVLHNSTTALHLCCHHKRILMTTFLVEAGADVDAEDIYVNTPLHVAALQNAAEIVQLLVEAGADGSSAALRNKVADPDAMDDHGETPLHLCCRHNYPTAARILLSHGANPNATNDYGETPLHVYLGHEDRVKESNEDYYLGDIMKLLVEHGANTALEDDYGRKAFDFSEYEPTMRRIKWGLNDYIKELNQLRQHQRALVVATLREENAAQPLFAADDIGSLVAQYMEQDLKEIAPEDLT